MEVQLSKVNEKLDKLIEIQQSPWGIWGRILYIIYVIVVVVIAYLSLTYTKKSYEESQKPQQLVLSNVEPLKKLMSRA